MSKRWRNLSLSILAFAIAAALHGSFHALVPHGAQVRPLLAALPYACAVIGMFAMIASAVVTIGHANGVGKRIGLVALHVLLGIAGPIAALASDPQFPLGVSHVDDLDLPDDRGRAYLYRGGLFCSQSVWIAAPGRWVAFEQPELGMYTCERGGTLSWDDTQQQVRVVDGSGSALPSPAWAGGLAEGLYWGPH